MHNSSRRVVALLAFALSAVALTPADASAARDTVTSAPSVDTQFVALQAPVHTAYVLTAADSAPDSLQVFLVAQLQVPASLSHDTSALRSHVRVAAVTVLASLSANHVPLHSLAIVVRQSTSPLPARPVRRASLPRPARILGIGIEPPGHGRFHRTIAV